MYKYEELIAKYNKKMPGTLRVGNQDYTDIPRIPFGNANFEWLLRGGIPQNRFVELFGPEGSGKTLLMYRFLREWQKIPENKKRMAMIFDYECSHDDRWATIQGVDMSRVVVWRPQNNESAEETFDIIKEFADTKEFGFMALDSVGALVPKNRKDKGSYEDKTMGGLSAPLTDFINDFNWRLSSYKITFIFINQLRDDFGNQYSVGKSPGGRALRHAGSIKLFISACEYFDEKGNSCSQYANPAGHHIQVVVTKNKISPGDRKRKTITFKYLTGIADMVDNIEFGILSGLIKGSGAWYELADYETGEVLPKKLNGKRQVEQYFIDNPEKYNAYVEKILEIARGD